MAARPRHHSIQHRPGLLSDALPALRAWLALPLRALLPGSAQHPDAPDAAAGSDWHAPFIAALCTSGLISEACHAAGVDVRTAYAERERSPAFDAAWREAQRARRAASRSNQVIR